MKDVRELYVNRLSGAADADDPPAAEFCVRDLASGATQWVPAPAADALALAIRFQQPVRLERSAVMASFAEALPQLALDSATGVEDAAAMSRLEMLVTACMPVTPLDRLLAVGFVRQTDWSCDSEGKDVGPLFEELRDMQARGVLAPRLAQA